MRLPGPLEWLSLLSAVVLATAPAAMAIYKLAEGAVLVATVYAAAAVLMFALPQLLVWRLPDPGELVRAAGRRVLDALVPWRTASDADE